MKGLQFIIGRRWHAGVDDHDVVHAVSVPALVHSPEWRDTHWTSHWMLYGLCTIDDGEDLRVLRMDLLENLAVTCIACVAAMSPT